MVRKTIKFISLALCTLIVLIPSSFAQGEHNQELAPPNQQQAAMVDQSKMQQSIQQQQTHITTLQTIEQMRLRAQQTKLPTRQSALHNHIEHMVLAEASKERAAHLGPRPDAMPPSWAGSMPSQEDWKAMFEKAEDTYTIVDLEKKKLFGTPVPENYQPLIDEIQTEYGDEIKAIKERFGQIKDEALGLKNEIDEISKPVLEQFREDFQAGKQDFEERRGQAQALRDEIKQNFGPAIEDVKKDIALLRDDTIILRDKIMEKYSDDIDEIRAHYRENNPDEKEFHKHHSDAIAELRQKGHQLRDKIRTLLDDMENTIRPQLKAFSDATGQNDQEMRALAQTLRQQYGPQIDALQKELEQIKEEATALRAEIKAVVDPLREEHKENYSKYRDELEKLKGEFEADYAELIAELRARLNALMAELEALVAHEEE